MSILIASNNLHKVAEFREIFAQFSAGDIEIVTPTVLGTVLDPDETADSYIGNARIKAEAFHHLVPDRCVLADDSGLEVDALGGAPGIRSARYHKAAPNQDGCAALLKDLKDVPEAHRAARFRAVIVLIAPDGAGEVFEGVCEGSIGFDRRGTGGFGFDPVFRVAGSTRHMAELMPEEKHRVSHRGLAAQKLIAWLRDHPMPGTFK